MVTQETLPCWDLNLVQIKWRFRSATASSSDCAVAINYQFLLHFPVKMLAYTHPDIA